MTSASDRFGLLIRQVTPLVLLALALVAMFGEWVPGAAWVAQQLGETFLLRLCLGILTLYVLLLWGESMRLHAMLTSVLRELVAFRNQRAAEAQGRPLSHRLDAARLLLPALSSSDDEVRTKSRKNLALLVGKDLGEDPAAWRAWVAEQEAAGKAGETP